MENNNVHVQYEKFFEWVEHRKSTKTCLPMDEIFFSRMSPSDQVCLLKKMCAEYYDHFHVMDLYVVWRWIPKKFRPSFSEILGDYFHQQSGGLMDQDGNQVILYESIQDNLFYHFPFRKKADQLLLKLERHWIRRPLDSMEMLRIVSRFIKHQCHSLCF